MGSLRRITSFIDRSSTPSGRGLNIQKWLNHRLVVLTSTDVLPEITLN
jgi:hypothetical protein